jgi:Cft2 family RNA processing exonuclease
MPPLTFTNLTRGIEIGANCYALDIAGKRLVLDAGSHPRLDGEEGLPLLTHLEDGSVDAIVLTHAHQDHVGSLPVLMRRQPRAPVFMTEATRLLSDVMLHNSINVMQRKTEGGQMPFPLFSHREVDVGTRRWITAPIHQPFDLTGERRRQDESGDEITIELFDAGHILGSAGAMIRAGGRSVFYTGDVNFHDQTVVRAARFPEEPLDVLIIETTRGDHPTPPTFRRADEELRFAQALKDAFLRGGSVLVPLFALGKTQEILAMFHGFRRKGLLHEGAIYIGGLSTKLTEIYDRLSHVTPRQQPDLRILPAVEPFTIAGREGQDIPLRPGRIYALSSGMMTEKTLSFALAREMLGDSRHSIFFVGYSDPDSPAGRIRAAAHGEEVQLSPDLPAQPLRCTVEQFAFSAHATRESIREYVNRVRPKTVVLVHGDASAIQWFQQTLQSDIPGSRVLSPSPGEPIEL